MRTCNAFLFVVLLILPFTTKAASVNFVEFGNDGKGNSFILNFSWNAATNSVTDVQSYTEYNNYSTTPIISALNPDFVWNPNLFSQPVPTVGAIVFNYKGSSALLAFFMLKDNNNMPNTSNFPDYNYALNDQRTNHQWFGYQTSISQIPEPTTIMLIISGIFGFSAFKRRLV